MTDIIRPRDAKRVFDALEPHYPEGVPEELIVMALEKLRKHRIDQAIWSLILAGKVTFRWEEDDWCLTTREEP